jgi:hypothetical protein
MHKNLKFVLDGIPYQQDIEKFQEVFVQEVKIFLFLILKELI